MTTRIAFSLPKIVVSGSRPAQTMSKTICPGGRGEGSVSRGPELHLQSTLIEARPGEWYTLAAEVKTGGALKLRNHPA